MLGFYGIAMSSVAIVLFSNLVMSCYLNDCVIRTDKEKNYYLSTKIPNNKKPIELEMLGLALSNIHEYYSSQVVFSVISNEDLRSRNISKEDSMEGLIGNTLRSVSGWTLVASLVEAEPDIVTVSLRTRDEKRYDVSKIAKSIGENGGGHTGAAGTTIHKPLGEAITSLLGVISEFYPELK